MVGLLPMQTGANARPARQLVRPEWLFEVVNRLQPFVSPGWSAYDAITPDEVVLLFAPKSDLEHRLVNALLIRLKAEGGIRSLPELRPETAIEPERVRI